MKNRSAGNRQVGGSIISKYFPVDLLASEMGKHRFLVRYSAIEATESETISVQLAIARIGVTDPDYSIRNQAASIIAVHGTSLDSYRVKLLLADKSWVVRSSAVEAVAKVFRRRAESILVQMLNDRHQIVRRDSAVALGDLGNQSSIAAVRARLQIEKHPQALLGLWEALFKLGERDHLTNLLALYDSDEPGLRTAVWATVNCLVEGFTLTVYELDEILEAVSRAESLSPSPSVLEPLNKVKSNITNHNISG